MINFDAKETLTYKGTNHANLINNVFGTHFRAFFKASVELSNWGAPGVIAWFVFMDGTRHGFSDGMQWENNLLIEKINEELVNKKEGIPLLYKKRAEEGYLPYRLAFQLDPFGKNDRYTCRFVGVYALTGFYDSSLTTMRYSKISDTFCLGNKDMGESVNTKEDIISKLDKYFTPIEQLNFSANLNNLFKRSNIQYAGELLEVGGLTNEQYQREIRQKLWECFKIE